jgi:membrane-bound lytic murein transglycosylase B
MLLLNMLIYKKILLISSIFLFSINFSYSNDINYDNWLLSLKSDALERGISEETFNNVMKTVIITPKVKKLDKKQPETNS